MRINIDDGDDDGDDDDDYDDHDDDVHLTLGHNCVID